MDTEAWKDERRAISDRIEELRRQGICYSCYHIQTGNLFPDEIVVWDDDLFRVILEKYPRMRGHTIIVWKPHRNDFSELEANEAAQSMRVCCVAAQAIKMALGAEKVYLNTMCDGEINRLHFQLLPRYVGDSSGSRRFVLPRQPIEHGAEDAAAISDTFKKLWSA